MQRSLPRPENETLVDWESNKTIGTESVVAVAVVSLSRQLQMNSDTVSSVTASMAYEFSPHVLSMAVA